MSELRPCPFCGGEAAFRTPSAKSMKASALVGGIMPTLVECRGCGAVVSFDSDDSYIACMRGKMREFTADAWNGRAEA